MYPCGRRLRFCGNWGKWEVDEVELDPPKAGEVLLKLTASGMCHSDYHLVTGDIPVNLPYVGGTKVPAWSPRSGPGVTDVEVGDSVVLSFRPPAASVRTAPVA